MKSYSLRKLPLAILSMVCFSVNASSESIEAAVKKETNEISNSTIFKQTVACYGISEAALEKYKKGLEDAFRYCLTNHPIKNIGDGRADDLEYNQCFYPKWRKAVELAGITDAMEKRCSNDDDE